MKRKGMSIFALLAACGLLIGAQSSIAVDDNNPPASSKPADAAGKDDKAKKDGEKKDDKAAAGAAIGATAPDFTLTDLDGKSHTLSSLKGKIVVLEWFNPECPFVVKQYEKTTVAKDIAAAIKGKDVVHLLINSGAPGKQGHGKELNKKKAGDWKITSPILTDEDGKVGKLFGAQTTPHIFIIGKDGNLAYKGAIDNNRDMTKAGDKNYVIQTVNQLIKGETVTEPETKPYGCSVKYKG